MHELSIAEALLQQALSAAAPHQALRITEVQVQVGVLRQVDPASLRTAFEALARDTIADAATLTVVEKPARLRCWGCDETFAYGGRDFACPSCRRADTEVVEGDEILLTSLTAQTAREAAAT